MPNPRPSAAAARSPPDPETLRKIAQVSGGQAFTAEDADAPEHDLQDARVTARVKDAKKETTQTFALWGLVFLLGAGVASLRLGGRVV